jgi:hypothetical protein
MKIFKMKLLAALPLIAISTSSLATDLNLVCDEKDAAYSSTVSLFMTGGRQTIQMDSMTYTDGVTDKFGGSSKVTESKTKFTVEYANPKKRFKSNLIINRLTGVMTVASSGINNKGEDFSLLETFSCRAASNKF